MRKTVPLKTTAENSVQPKSPAMKCRSTQLLTLLAIGAASLLALILSSSAAIASPKELQPILDALTAEDPVVRYLAMELISSQSEKAIPGLLRALDDVHPAVIWASAVLLGRARTPLAVGPLQTLLNHSNQEIAHAALWALGNIGSDAESAAPTVAVFAKSNGINFLKHGGQSCDRGWSEERILRTAAWALSRMGERGVEWLHAEAMSEKADERRLWLKQLAWAIPNRFTVDVLTAAINGSDARDGAVAAKTLNHLLHRCMLISSTPRQYHPYGHDGSPFMPCRGVKDVDARALLELARISAQKVVIDDDKQRSFKSGYYPEWPEPEKPECSLQGELLALAAHVVVDDPGSDTLLLKLAQKIPACSERATRKLLEALHNADSTNTMIDRLAAEGTPCVRKMAASWYRSPDRDSLAPGVLDELIAKAMNPSVSQKERQSTVWRIVQASNGVTPPSLDVFLRLLDADDPMVASTAAGELMSRATELLANKAMIETALLLSMRPWASQQDAALERYRAGPSPFVGALSMVRGEPYLPPPSSSLFVGQVERDLPSWIDLGVQATPGILPGIDILPAKSNDQQQCLVLPKHRRIASQMVRGEPVSPQELDAFIDSFFWLEQEVPANAQTDVGIPWSYQSSGCGSQLWALFTEFNGCGKESHELNPTCWTTEETNHFIDGEPYYFRGNAYLSPMLYMPGIPVRNLSLGRHELATILTFTVPSRIPEKPIELVVRRSSVVEVDSAAEAKRPPPIRNESLAAELGSKIKVSRFPRNKMYQVRRPEVDTRLLELEITDHTTRSVDLAFRVEVTSDSRTLLPVEGSVYDENESCTDEQVRDFCCPGDVSFVNVDLSSLPSGPSRLQLRLIPDPSVAARHFSKSPYLDSPVDLEPLWVLRSASGANTSWVPSIQNLLIEERHLPTLSVAFQAIETIGEGASSLVPILMQKVRELRSYSGTNDNSTLDFWRSQNTKKHGPIWALRAIGPAAQSAASELLPLIEGVPANDNTFSGAAIEALVAMRSKESIPILEAMLQRISQEQRKNKVLPNAIFARSADRYWAIAKIALAELQEQPCALGQFEFRSGTLLYCAEDRHWHFKQFFSLPLPLSTLYIDSLKWIVFIAKIETSGNPKSLPPYPWLSFVLIIVPLELDSSDARPHTARLTQVQNANVSDLEVGWSQPDRAAYAYELMLKRGFWSPTLPPRLVERENRIEVQAKGDFAVLEEIESIEKNSCRHGDINAWRTLASSFCLENPHLCATKLRR